MCYNGVQYNMDVKWKYSLCNCAPSKIKGYGEYKWVNPTKLREIPRLPDDVFNMITSNATTAAARPSVPSRPGTTTNSTVTTTTVATATTSMQEDVRALCNCLNMTQLDNYQTWVRLGMILKNLGMPVEFWEEARKAGNTRRASAGGSGAGSGRAPSESEA